MLVYRAENTGDFFQQAGFRRRVFVGTLRANAEGAGDFVAGADGNAERAADAGLLRTGFGDAAGVGLEIAHGHRFAARGGGTGDAFADRNRFHYVEHERRQADLGGELEELRVGVEFVDRAGFGIEGGENYFQRLGEGRFGAAFGLEQGLDLFG